MAQGSGLGDRVGPIARLALHRIAQESLADAATHAAGADVVVEIDDRDPREVTLTVTNGGGHEVPIGRRGFGLAQGISNEEIAANLVVEVSTVKSHLARMLPKIGVRSRLQAVVWAYQNGVAAVPDP